MTNCGVKNLSKINDTRLNEIDIIKGKIITLERLRWQSV